MASLTSQINVVVDTKTKNEAARILDDLGLSMSTAINIYLKQIIKNSGIPFEIKTREQFIKENEITDEYIMEKLKEAEKEMKLDNTTYTLEEVYKIVGEKFN